MRWLIIPTILLLGGCDDTPSAATEAPPPSQAAGPGLDQPAHDPLPADQGIDESAHPYDKALAAIRAKDNDKVITYLKECVEAEPDNAQCHKALGTAYTAARRIPQAVLAYRRYLELKPDAEDADKIRALVEAFSGHRAP